MRINGALQLELSARERLVEIDRERTQFDRMVMASVCKVGMVAAGLCLLMALLLATVARGLADEHESAVAKPSAEALEMLLREEAAALEAAGRAVVAEPADPLADALERMRVAEAEDQGVMAADAVEAAVGAVADQAAEAAVSLQGDVVTPAVMERRGTAADGAGAERAVRWMEEIGMDVGVLGFQAGVLQETRKAWEASEALRAAELEARRARVASLRGILDEVRAVEAALQTVPELGRLVPAKIEVAGDSGVFPVLFRAGYRDVRVEDVVVFAGDGVTVDDGACRGALVRSSASCVLVVRWERGAPLSGGFTVRVREDAGVGNKEQRGEVVLARFEGVAVEGEAGARMEPERVVDDTVLDVVGDEQQAAAGDATAGFEACAMVVQAIVVRGGERWAELRSTGRSIDGRRVTRVREGSVIAGRGLVEGIDGKGRTVTIGGGGGERVVLREPGALMGADGCHAGLEALAESLLE